MKRLLVVQLFCLRQYKIKDLLLVKIKEKKLLKIQPLPKVLRVQAIKDQSNYVTYITATHTRAKRRWLSYIYLSGV
jgi:hypothetical protein